MLQKIYWKMSHIQFFWLCSEFESFRILMHIMGKTNFLPKNCRCLKNGNFCQMWDIDFVNFVINETLKLWMRFSKWEFSDIRIFPQFEMRLFQDDFEPLWWVYKSHQWFTSLTLLIVCESSDKIRQSWDSVIFGKMFAKPKRVERSGWRCSHV